MRGGISGSQRSPVGTDLLPNGCPVGLRKCQRGSLQPSLGLQCCEPARAGPAKPEKAICTLVQEGMATDDALQGLVPKTKRKGSKLFLGHAQDSCLVEGGSSTLRPLPPLALGRAAAAPGHRHEPWPLQKRRPPARPAWAGRPGTQVPLQGPADSDMTRPTTSQLLLLEELGTKTAWRSPTTEGCQLAPCLTHPTEESVSHEV